MDDAAALKRLKLLLKEEGALKIINHFHACTDQLVTDAMVAADMGLPANQPAAHVAVLIDGEVRHETGGVPADAKLGSIAKQCVAYAAANGHAAGMPGGYTSVGHYRLHDVKRLEQNRNKPETYTAYADDELGTQCSGYPTALLARLTEHERD